MPSYPSPDEPERGGCEKPIRKDIEQEPDERPEPIEFPDEEEYEGEPIPVFVPEREGAR